LDLAETEARIVLTLDRDCVFRRSRSAFRAEADQDSGAMTIAIGAKRRWLVS
jgi:hypothetical protein